ncbi:hypothetical protein [Calothrix sp. PCC 6303]|uniref:hypothetical protein n=1 Tax=Calothrix sp. PCC 6303 TaxID=1170562 RepID=UPI0002A027E5|nr:hypothetical protein [Calothrix sp. PCC 6303]AFZ01546.1 hypothetical protein Cal6303_2564 [Calothrix sp. PCC 6303]
MFAWEDYTAIATASPFGSIAQELVANLGMVTERDIAFGLCLLGVCFGFQFFCANYYEATKPGFFLEF